MTTARDAAVGRTMAPMGARIHPDRRRPLRPSWVPWRRIALALVAYGVAGIALAVASIVILAGPAQRLQQMAGQQAEAVRWLDMTDQALADAQQSTTGAATSLTAAQTSARSATDLFRELQSSMAGMRDATGITIFGTQPLAGLGAGLGRVADRSGALADDIAALGDTLGTESTNLGRLSADIASLRTELAGVRLALDGSGISALQDVLRGLAGLAIMIVLWLTLPALASLAAGLAILRRLRWITRGPPGRAVSGRVEPA